MTNKKTIINLTRMSKVFQPMATELSDTGYKTELISQSHKLLINYGIIKPVSMGMYALLPLGIRVLNKFINLVDKEMTNLGAEKILLPALTSTSLWKKTNRYDSNESELFKVKDRHDKEYILSPKHDKTKLLPENEQTEYTEKLFEYDARDISFLYSKFYFKESQSKFFLHTYEEAICDLISSTGHLSTKLLPLRLYQISSKWRDEKKPRLGFLRSREFIMKDLYTFDTNLDNAQHTYDQVCESYNNIFKHIGIKYEKVIGNVGTIGGLVSHEYHYISNIGEDVILKCPLCYFSINQTISKTTTCPKCKNELQQHTTAEIGHTFLLNTKYSQPLRAMYMEQNKLKPMAMGCFGLGLSRILTLTVEILSTINEIRWPVKLAPYTVCIIPPKIGSKEESGSKYIEQLYENLCKRDIDIILDDRTYWTIGKRFIFDRAIGYPYIIIIGKASIQPIPLFEVHDINNSVYNELSLEQINHYFDNIHLKT